MTILKTLLSIALASSLTFSLVACSAGTKVVDLTNTEESSASTFLLNQDLLPEISEEFSDDVEPGLVIRTEPEANTSVSPGTKVKVFVSKGPKIVESVDSNIEWYNISSDRDDWNFSSPYIDDGILTIETSDVKFARKMEWRDGEDGDGLGFGRASITDSFNKSVPISIVYQKKVVPAGEKQDLTLLIPTADLDKSKPTTIYLELYIKVNGQDEEVRINFTISW
jgi:hypothetical protein